VQIPVEKVDRAKLDDPMLLSMVVEVTDAGLFRLATKHGLLARCVHASYLHLPNIGVEAAGMGNVLQNMDGGQWTVYKDADGNWLKGMTLREAAKKSSRFGGQGYSTENCCGCKGKCDSRRCNCLAHQRYCTSSCHPRNICCSNKPPTS